MVSSRFFIKMALVMNQFKGGNIQLLGGRTAVLLVDRDKGLLLFLRRKSNADLFRGRSRSRGGSRSRSRGGSGSRFHRLRNAL